MKLSSIFLVTAVVTIMAGCGPKKETQVVVQTTPAAPVPPAFLQRAVLEGEEIGFVPMSNGTITFTPSGDNPVSVPVTSVPVTQGVKKTIDTLPAKTGDLQQYAVSFLPEGGGASIDAGSVQVIDPWSNAVIIRQQTPPNGGGGVILVDDGSGKIKSLTLSDAGDAVLTGSSSYSVKLPSTNVAVSSVNTHP